MIYWVRKVYLDHNATTPVAPQVSRAMRNILEQTPGNPSSLHTAGRAARGVVENARSTVAELLGCLPDNVYFTSGGTEGNNAVIKGCFTAAGGKGHIITAKIEHESVLGACHQVEQAGGRVTYLAAGPDGCMPPHEVEAAIAPDTILISIMHGNNETGVLQPVREISRIAREAGIPFHTDAVQTFGKIPTRVDEIGCDFLTLTAHKINGPKAVGALYCRNKMAWAPLIFGGDQEKGMRAGTEGVHQIAGLAAAVRLARLRMQKEHDRLLKLRATFIHDLSRAFPDVRINQAAPEHQLPGTISATFPGREGIRILAGLDCYEVRVSIGSACTADRIEPSHVLLGMGIPVADALSTIRLSMGTSTTAGELRYVIEVLKKVLRHDPPGLSYLDPQHLNEERIRAPKTFLIDLRFPYERLMSQTIPGAREWSHIYFDRYIKQIPTDGEVILMCGTGIFSFSAGYRLAQRGHPNVKVVYGGYAAWTSLHPGLIARLGVRS